MNDLNKTIRKLIEEFVRQIMEELSKIGMAGAETKESVEETIVRAFWDCWRFISWKKRDRDSAEEVFQEVLIIVAKKLLDPEKLLQRVPLLCFPRLRKWLRTTASRKIIAMGKKRHHEVLQAEFPESDLQTLESPGSYQPASGKEISASSSTVKKVLQAEFREMVLQTLEIPGFYTHQEKEAAQIYLPGTLDGLNYSQVIVPQMVKTMNISPNYAHKLTHGIRRKLEEYLRGKGFP